MFNLVLLTSSICISYISTINRAGWTPDTAAASHHACEAKLSWIQFYRKLMWQLIGFDSYSKFELKYTWVEMYSSFTVTRMPSWNVVDFHSRWTRIQLNRARRTSERYAALRVQDTTCTGHNVGLTTIYQTKDNKAHNSISRFLNESKWKTVAFPDTIETSQWKSREGRSSKRMKTD